MSENSHNVSLNPFGLVGAVVSIYIALNQGHFLEIAHGFAGKTETLAVIVVWTLTVLGVVNIIGLLILAILLLFFVFVGIGALREKL